MGQTMGADFSRLRKLLPDIQRALVERGLGGWLLFDLHARNSVAVQLLGLGDLSRRYFVLIRPQGDPAAIIHGIEEGPWERWPWARLSYVGWRELADALRSLLEGAEKVAMEFSDRNAVPAVDLVPAGVIELVRSTDVEVVSSGDLISRFYSRWSKDQLASHRRASNALAEAAQASFQRLARAIERREKVDEGMIRGWVGEALRQRGVIVGADAIVATGRNAANPHYEPVGGGATFQPADVVLLDLWGKETEDSVYADQTWMAYLGAAVPDRAAKLFAIVRDARDAAVEFVERAWREGRTLQGGEVDDVTRGVITDQGYGAFFIHRTGHSIDQAIHGMGPNIDNLETREVRQLIPGIGFSIEPGIYIPGEIGIRSEIDVFIGDHGPEVTTPHPQREMMTLLRG